jgi:hypothetical protein
VTSLLGSQRLSSVSRVENPEESVPLQQLSGLYDGYTQADVENTFKYMFHKFKKGIFARIQNGQVVSFVPFSKAMYINEWSDLIKVDPKYGGNDDFERMENFFKAHNNLVNCVTGKKFQFDVKKVNLDPSFWFANNCILRYENPINECDTNCMVLKSMFEELCADRLIPDVSFFINRRDFPILTKNGTEPYNHIYGYNVPLKSYKFKKYAPVLSMCSSDNFADISIPTHEDWVRVKSVEDGQVFPPKNLNYSHTFNRAWNSKIPKAVFRGSNTGYGCTFKDNVRLNLARLQASNKKLLDVGITNWNLRIRKIKGSPYLQIPQVEGLELVSKLTAEEQSNYKYLINVDGHVSAFRLSQQLGMNCCVLMVESELGGNNNWKMWFSDNLRPYEHFIPVKADLSDLTSQIQWCVRNDDKCETISKNARSFYDRYLTKKGVLDHLAQLMHQLNRAGVETGNFTDPLIGQWTRERAAVTPKSLVNYRLTGEFPQHSGRNYGTLKGLEMFVEQSVRPTQQITFVGVEEKVVFQSKMTKVVVYMIGSKRIVAKRCIDKVKKIEIAHSVFVGKCALNNMLKICPNFVYTLGYRDEPNTTMIWEQGGRPVFEKEATALEEYLEGPTLQNFLKTCTTKAYLEVLMSLNCALLLAQTIYGFVHQDLTPWNIVVEVLENPIALEYYSKTSETGDRIAYRIRTRYVPVMLDYGKSHVIVDNVHVGVLDPFNSDKNIDIVTLLVTSLNELMSLREHSVDFQVLLYIGNFLSSKKITNSKDLKRFLRKAKKVVTLGVTLEMRYLFTTMFSRDTSIESFFKYMVPVIHKFKLSFGKVSMTLDTWSSNSRQIADMGFGLEMSEKVESYLEIVRRIYRHPLPKASNKFTCLLIAQRMYEGLVAPKMEFVEFAAEFNLDQKIIKEVLIEFNKMEAFMVSFYFESLYKKKNVNFSLGIDEEQITVISNFTMVPSRALFLGWSSEDQNHLERETTGLDDILPPYSYYRKLIIDVLRNQGPFRINNEDAVFYKDVFKHVLDDHFMNKVASIETIRTTVRKMKAF